ncbi:E3 ubiquitin-protein ligase UBR3, partial [Paragonimus westermani]
PDADLKLVDEFISYVCCRLNLSQADFRREFCDACANSEFDSPVYQSIMKMFEYDCFSSDRFRIKKAKMQMLTKLFEFLIAGDQGIQNMGRKLKEYDYSARCSLVWTTNYFAYRCRTCAISPSMSLCSSCFTSGNHTGHDFNKFRSLAGGACDCGDSNVMHPSGYCRFHGPDKVHNRPSPPDDLVAPLRCLLPRFLPALLYWFWELCSGVDPTTLTDEVAPALFVLHVLHACGWVTQKMIADVLIDRSVFQKLQMDCAHECAYGDYVNSVETNPLFNLPRKSVNNSVDTSIIANQTLIHRHLLDAFLYCTIKLRFPESLVTFLIGLLAVQEFKEEFVQSYLNHYTRVASTVMISGRSRMATDWSQQMNNRIVHISVQLFSGQSLAFRMVQERHLHYRLVHCLLNMFDSCRTRLDDRSNMVVYCDGPLIPNNVFWPFVSDLSNLVSHKAIVDVFVEDPEFLQAWTKVLRYMQFMNCFVLREGDHIEYETMAFYHAVTMEIEMSANPMWNIWQHYRHPQSICFVLIYLIIACAFSFSILFTFQACATLLPPIYVINTLLDPTRLLRGVHFLDELFRLVAPPEPRNLDRKPMALEAWLMNLCWILDLRNNICLTEDELLKKELLCVLAPEPRKRSDLSSLIPERCGISDSNTNLDEMLKKVASYSAPSCDEASGSLISGLYYLRPSLWHTDFDPIFHSLRVTSRREAAVAIEKYREHCRQRHGIVNSSALWPPYRTPKQLPNNFKGLDHLLHSRHLHFLLFIQLSLYVYGDPLVTEESLSLIVHLLDRGLDTPCRVDAKGRKCCYTLCRNTQRGPSGLHPAPYDGTLVDADDELMECANSRLTEYADGQGSNILLDALNVDEEDPEDADDVTRIISQFFEKTFKDPNNPFCSEFGQPSSDFDSTTDAKRNRLPHWDPSLFKCAYQPRTNLQDNLGCWLMVENWPTPRVCPAPTLLATQAGVPTAAHSAVYVIPDHSDIVHEGNESGVLVDNLLTLLIKAHARLHWSRVSGSSDSIPKVLVGNSFMDPNIANPPDDSVIPLIEDLITTDQVQVNNIVLGLHPPPPPPEFHNLLSYTQVSRQMQPRCMAVLGGNSARSRSSDFGVSNNMAALENDAPPSSTTSATRDLTPNTLAQLPPELRYFAAGPPAYSLVDERTPPYCEISDANMATSAAGENNPPCPDLSDVCFTDEDRKNVASGQLCTSFGDGAFWIERLLDKIAASSSGNKAAIRFYLARARRPFENVARVLRLQPMDSFSSCTKMDVEPPTTLGPTDVLRNKPAPSFNENRSAPSLSAPAPGAAAVTREERKKAALERRKRLMEQMACKQKAFALTHFKDMELISQPVEEQQVLVETAEKCYECVICQTSGTASSDDMVLLDMMCESGITLHMRETSLLPQLNGRQPTQACGLPAEIPPSQDSSWLVPTRPPNPPADSANPQLLQPSDADFVPSGGSGQAPTGTVGVSVLAAHFEASAPLQHYPSGSLSPAGTPSIQLSSSVPPSPSPNHWLLALGTTSSAPSPAVPAAGVNPGALGPASCSSSQSCFVESRRWWGLALPPQINRTLPLLRSGLILQTCGHVVHRECFQRYRSQGGSRGGPPRNRAWILCPLCRRDVHHLLPLVPLPSVDREKLPNQRTPADHISMLQTVLSNLVPEGKSLWEDLNGAEDEGTMQRRTLMSQLIGGRFEATVLLRFGTIDLLALSHILLGIVDLCACHLFRASVAHSFLSQLECELSVLMCCPSQYSSVERRCSWREFLSYIRQIYKYPSDLLAMLYCLTEDSASVLQESESGPPNTPIFALCQDPGDILLTLVPHVWPREDVFLTLVAATVSLAYVRAVISALLNSPISNNVTTSPLVEAESLVSKLSGPVAAHVRHLLPLLQKLLTQNYGSSNIRDCVSRFECTLLQAAKLSETEPDMSDEWDQNQFELHIVLRLLPLLRLAGLCRARWQTTDDDSSSGSRSSKLNPIGLPFVGQLTSTLNSSQGPSTVAITSPRITAQQRLLEFSDLSRILSLDCGDTTVLNVALVAEFAAARSGLFEKLTAGSETNVFFHLINRWFSQFSDNRSPGSAVTVDKTSSDLASSSQSGLVITEQSTNTHRIWTRNLGALVEIGRQLYSPRLIRTPYCFDVLFNTLHLVSCDAVQHRFQDNALCLICGRLLCTLCTNLSTVMVEHAYSCEGFAGIVLEVNSSIVYVSLGPNVCDWGSIYLDAYGEEDLELKRGKPLFLNEERFALLEHQWLSHSFRHVLKHWRIV